MVQRILAAHARAVELLGKKKQGFYPSGNRWFTCEFLQREFGVRQALVELRHPCVASVSINPREKLSTVIRTRKTTAQIAERLTAHGFEIKRIPFRGAMVTGVFHDSKKLAHIVEKPEGENGVEVQAKKTAVRALVETIFAKKSPPPLQRQRPFLEVQEMQGVQRF